MSPPAIITEFLSKEFSGAPRFDRNLINTLCGERRAPRPFQALHPISIEIAQGEALGILGPNGAGKSTLLKLLARIMKPTGGHADIRGRVGALLQVGAGFHPELTGRENVFFNGVVLGMKRTEVARKFDEIVAFSGVEQFIDLPVKRYSSGMYMRLAFSVAAHLDTDVLLLDEVLAVGDLEFRRRSQSKMASLVRDGRTVVLVSHDMGALRELTDRCLYLRTGQVAAVGPSAEVIDLFSAERY